MLVERERVHLLVADLHALGVGGLVEFGAYVEARTPAAAPTAPITPTLVRADLPPIPNTSSQAAPVGGPARAHQAAPGGVGLVASAIKELAVAEPRQLASARESLGIDRGGDPRTFHATDRSMRRRIRTWSRGSQGGRPPAFDKEAYTRRNVVERCFNRLKQQALDGEEFGRELVESGDVL
jgi:hypothetical protein